MHDRTERNFGGTVICNIPRIHPGKVCMGINIFREDEINRIKGLFSEREHIIRHQRQIAWHGLG